jgi:hypothetical protein
VCFVVRKTTSELESVILTTLYLAGAKNTDNIIFTLSNDPAHPHGPVSRLLPPPAPEQSVQAATTDRPRAAPWSAPTTSTGGKITAASHLLHSPIKRRHSLSSIPVTSAFNPGALKLLQRRPLKAPGLPRLASAI